MKIFLEENRSEFSNNVENTIDIGFSTKTRLLPNDNLSDTFSLFEQYNRERDECNKYRVILGINPLCSNILFNKKTEILINEGSDECVSILDGMSYGTDEGGVEKSRYSKNSLNETENITYYQCIRDTEYSHEGNGKFVYHCGSDIFNNHMIRSTDFTHVNKMSLTARPVCNEIYNTILDLQRDNEGDIVSQKIAIKYGQANVSTRMHLYQYDTIQSMEQAFSEKCSEKDGWWGFTNPGNIEIPTNSGNTILVNRMMAGNKPCEFVDLYPDRTMFSFVPNFNRYRRRIEKNWDLCLTYPYEADYDWIDRVCGGENQAVRASIKYTVSNTSTPMLECSTWFKHNLKVGDYVNFYYYLPHYRIEPGRAASASNIDILTMIDYKFYLTDTLNNDGSVNNNISVLVKSVQMEDDDVTPKMDFHRMNAKVRVVSVGDANGDHTDKVFSVRFADVQGIYEYIKFFGCFYKKNVSNTECQYYFRKLKKLKNSESEALRYDINKSAFGLNIYGDDVAQAVFIDDVDLTGLMDHNGRPVSEIYLTVVKRNQGHVEWYENNTFNTEDIEYSHCFGKVTAGIDFSGIEDEPFDYNVHYLHNMDRVEVGIDNSVLRTASQEVLNTFSAWGETVLDGRPSVVEEDITIDDDIYMGDVVEYDVANAKETVIGDMCFRFNTAQRETWNGVYKSTYQDVIVSDDYDQMNGVGKAWSCCTYYLNDITNAKRNTTSRVTDLMYGNISPEGYFYKAHIPIRVREDDDDCTTSSAKYINYANPRFSTGGTYTVQHADGTTTVYENKATALANTNTTNGDVLYEENQYYQLVITVPVDYGFYKGDYMAFYNSATTELTWGEIVSVSGLELTLKFDYDGFATIENVGERHFKQGSADRVLYAYWSTDNVPLYAKLSMGQRKFVWRKIVPPSEMIQDDELYNTPFTNGCFYLEKNVNFFLKRQDPTGKYGLSVPMYRRHAQTVSNPMQKFTVAGYDPVDLTEIATIVNNALTTCY